MEIYNLLMKSTNLIRLITSKSRNMQAISFNNRLGLIVQYMMLIFCINPVKVEELFEVVSFNYRIAY